MNSEKLIWKLSFRLYRHRINDGYGHYAALCYVDTVLSDLFGVYCDEGSKILDRLFGWM